MFKINNEKDYPLNILEKLELPKSELEFALQHFKENYFILENSLFSDRQKIMLNLWFKEKKSQKEIAKITGYSIYTVRGVLYKAIYGLCNRRKWFLQKNNPADWYGTSVLKLGFSEQANSILFSQTELLTFEKIPFDNYEYMFTEIRFKNVRKKLYGKKDELEGTKNSYKTALALYEAKKRGFNIDD